MDALRLGTVTGTLGGLAVAAGIVWMRAPQFVTFVEPIPVVRAVTVREPVAVPVVPAPQPDALGCPELAADDETIGVPVVVTPRLEPVDPSPIAQVVAAAHASVLALRTTAGKVRVSDDDGKTFRAVLTDRTVDEIRIDAEGTLFARAGSDLAVLAPGARHASWRTFDAATCDNEGCRDEIGVAGDRLVWIRGRQLASSRDRGRTWKLAPDDMPWSQAQGTLLTWHGSLYQLEHYEDECGLDESPTWRFDPDTNAVTVAIINNEPVEGNEVLRPTSDVDPSWTWTRQCRQESPSDLGPCREVQVPFALLLAKTLRPVEGARTLSVSDNGSLIELCRGGARQVYRQFPFGSIETVDSHGRPLIIDGSDVVRWSPAHGWRRIARL